MLNQGSTWKYRIVWANFMKAYCDDIILYQVGEATTFGLYIRFEFINSQINQKILDSPGFVITLSGDDITAEKTIRIIKTPDVKVWLKGMSNGKKDWDKVICILPNAIYRTEPILDYSYYVLKSLVKDMGLGLANNLRTTSHILTDDDKKLANELVEYIISIWATNNNDFRRILSSYLKKEKEHAMTAHLRIPKEKKKEEPVEKMISPKLYLKKRDGSVKCTGYVSGTGKFIVAKGSIISPVQTKATKLKRDLTHVRVLKNGKFKLTKDIKFSGPTPAAIFCFGYFDHGEDRWKSAEGISYAQMKKEKWF